MTTTDGTVADDILRTLRRLVVAQVLLYVLVLAVVIWVYVDSGNKADDLARTTSRTTGALCAFRDDLQSRIDQTESFLATHPKGFAGVPKATLEQGLTGQRRTVKALAPLDCPAPPLP